MVGGWALEPLHIEASTHDLTHAAQGARVLCRLMLEEPAPTATATDAVDLETTPVLCSVVRVVDERGRGVSQNNLYLTIPSPTIRHHEYAGSLAQFQGLPVEAGIHELVVCDQCLKLIVPAGDASPASLDGDGGEGDDAVPLRYIAPPRHGRLH